MKRNTPTNPIVSVRFLRRGEDVLWRRCAFSSKAEEESNKPPFTDKPSFRADRAEAHLVAEQDGRIVGKMESILHEPHEAILIDPVVVPEASVEQVAGELLAKALEVAKSLKVRRIMVILQDRLPYIRELIPRMGDWGFRALWEKNLYRLNPLDLPPYLDSPLWADLNFASFGGLDDRVFRATLDLVLQSATNPEEKGETAIGMLEYFVDGCNRDGNYFPEDWELALINDEPVGVVIPAYYDEQRQEAGDLFVGVVPTRRGQGLGKLLYYRGLRTIGKRGVTTYIDSTDRMNRPMIRVFESLNFRQIMTQYYFEPADET